MSVETLVATMLSVDYLFGAASALAFRKEMSGLFGSIFDRASGEADSSADSEPLNGN